MIKDFGPDAFDYGLLFGHEAVLRFIGDATADIFVTFPNTRICEFLGAYYFLLSLDTEQTTIEDKHLELLNIKTFLSFCLWWLSSDGHHFELHNKDKVYNSLVALIAAEIDHEQLVLQEAVEQKLTFMRDRNPTHYPTMNFFGKILSLCLHPKELYVNPDAPVDEILESVKERLPSVNVIGNAELDSSFVSNITHSLIVVESTEQYMGLADRLTRYLSADRNPCLYLHVRNDSELSNYATDTLEKLYLSGYTRCTMKALPDFQMSCPFLTELYFSDLRIDESVLVVLSKAKLPVLHHLSFNGCGQGLKGKLSLLFESVWPSLTHFSLNGNVNGNDIHKFTFWLGYPEIGMLPGLESLALDLEVEESDRLKQSFYSWVDFMFQFHMRKLRAIHLHNLTYVTYQSFASGLNRGNMPNLGDLGIAMRKNAISNQIQTAEEFNLLKTPNLEELTLNRFISSVDILHRVTKNATSSHLHTLNISHSSGITGNLSVILCHSLPSLNSLVLSNCGLNSQDLCGLAQASVKGRLPQLKLLDLSYNENISGQLNYLFFQNCKWEGIQGFDLTNFASQNDVRFLAQAFSSGALKSLRNFVCFGPKTATLLKRIQVPLKNLRRIETDGHPRSIREIFQSITIAMDQSLLPTLDTIVINLNPEDIRSIVNETEALSENICLSTLASIESVDCQLSADLRQSPSRAAELVASLDPPIADRISGVFPDLNTGALESVMNEFTETLVEILPDLLDRSQDIKEYFKKKTQILLFPLFARMLGVAVGDQLVYDWDTDKEIAAYVKDAVSAVSSDVKWKLRKRGIKIYLVNQPDSGSMFCGKTAHEPPKAGSQAGTSVEGLKGEVKSQASG